MSNMQGKEQTAKQETGQHLGSLRQQRTSHSAQLSRRRYVPRVPAEAQDTKHKLQAASSPSWPQGGKPETKRTCFKFSLWVLLSSSDGAEGDGIIWLLPVISKER